MRTRFPRSADELLAYEPGRLAAVYASGSVPEAEELARELRGRVVRWHGAGRVATLLLGRVLGQPRFRWHGADLELTIDQPTRFILGAAKRAGRFSAFEIRRLTPGLWLGRVSILPPYGLRARQVGYFSLED